jgi:O-antigen/teichoic acid export membrane protein
MVAWTTHSLQCLLLWYLAVALAEGGLRHSMARRSIAMHASKERASWSEIGRLLPGTMAMSLAVVLSGLTTQMDKLILSKMVALEQVGVYVIASSVALGLLSLTYPLIHAIFPALLAVQRDKRQIRKIFLNWLAVAALAAIAVMAFYAGLGEAMLTLWLRNSDTAAAVFPVLFVLLVGTSLNVIYQVGYIGWMLEANYRMPLIVNAISMGLTLLIAPMLIGEYGILGAAAGWLFINTLGLLFSLSWFRKTI